MLRVVELLESFMRDLLRLERDPDIFNFKSFISSACNVVKENIKYFVQVLIFTVRNLKENACVRNVNDAVTADTFFELTGLADRVEKFLQSIFHLVLKLVAVLVVHLED